MAKVLSFLLVFLIHNTLGHSDHSNLELKNDADLQEELMPQELNTQFIPGKESARKTDDSPWRAIVPLVTRTRRDTNEVAVLPEAVTAAVQSNYKLYSRVASCIALIIAAALEITLFLFEYYK